MQIELELLAPAKNKEIGIAAIDCGADALYIAGPKFGARAQAGNSFNEIKELVDYAHKFGVKIYIVINTILYDNELEDVKSSIWEAYNIGCDAIIVQDLSILKMDIPPIEIFASTQTNIRNVEQAKFLESLGFNRLILARELSLAQIEKIHNNVNVDLESFVHGALCVSYSGQCYLSQKLTGRSANRGECSQACRANYTLINQDGEVLIKNEPLLSLKDLNLSNSIPELIKAGITSFKIEGRLKGESYVRNIVYNYRTIINNYLKNNKDFCQSSWGVVLTDFIPLPNKTFNRGYTNLFINGERDMWRSQNGAKHVGEFLGIVTKSGNNKKGVAQFQYQSKENEKIINGDGLCIITPKGELLGIRANSCEGIIVTTTDKINIPVKSKIYRNYDINFERRLQSSIFKRVIPVTLAFSQNDNGYVINVLCNKIKFDYKIEQEKQQASNIDLALRNIKGQLSKQTDHFVFTITDISVTDVPFYPISLLNGIRREIADILSKKLEEERLHNKIKQRQPKKEINFEQQYRGYLLNISNNLSNSFYKSLGFRDIKPAYEIVREENAELMRTKYCIKYQIGLCPKQGKAYNRKLYIVNGTNKFELKFDCAKCEMVIIG